MKYCILLLFLTGCFATSKHVDKTEQLSVELFTHILRDDQAAQPVLADLKSHVDEGSGAKISPAAVKMLGDGLLPGVGGLLLTTALGVYAKKKKSETDYVTAKAVKAASERDPDKAKAMLADDDQIRGYNG